MLSLRHITKRQALATIKDKEVFELFNMDEKRLILEACGRKS